MLTINQSGVVLDYLTQMFGGYSLPTEIVLEDADISSAVLECITQHPEESPGQQYARAVARLAWQKYGRPRDAKETDGAVGSEAQPARNLAYISDTLKRELPKLEATIDGMSLVVSLQSAAIEKNTQAVETSKEAALGVARSVEANNKGAAMDALLLRTLLIEYWLKARKILLYAAIWAGLMFVLLSICAVRSFAQVDIIKFQEGGASKGQFASPFTINFQSGCTLTHSIAGATPKMTIDCSGGAAASTTGTGFWHNTAGSLDAASVQPTISTTAPLGGGGALDSAGLTLTCAGCLTSVTAHNLFSVTHGDTVAASPVRGDIIIANSTPAWTKLALGAATSGKYAKSNGTDVIISTGSASGTGTPTACTNQFVTGFTLNADAAPTSTCTTDTLAGAQHANQGTTTTVLHGNAAGNPSFASVTATDFGTQTANTVLAGPTSGSAATPTFRAVTNADLPVADFAQWTNLPNVKFINAQSGNIGTGSIDLYTVPASKKAIVRAMTWYNSTVGSITALPEVKVSGTYYKLAASATITTLTRSTANVGIVLQAADVLATLTGGTGLNVTAQIIEFDSTASINTARVLAPASGDNTVYTVTAAKTAILLNQNFVSDAGGGVTTAGPQCFNDSGGSLNFKVYLVLSGGSTGTTNQFTALTTITNGTLTQLQTPGTLAAGDFLVVNASGTVSSGSLCWVNYVEF